MILSLLGLPEDDFPRMMKLTQEMFGGDDEEHRRGGSAEDLVAVLTDFFNYFGALTASRRANPTDDLASAIANGRVDGELMSDMDTLSYYVIVASAGHDTTKDAITGGLLALITEPRRAGATARRHGSDADRRRGDDPVDDAGKGVHAHRRRGHHGSRCADRQGRIRLSGICFGKPRRGRFSDPFRFDVGRDPNKHLAFGYGVHFCLGAALARMEMNSLFTELVPRLESIELAGDPELSATTFVGGLKHLPIRYSLR